MEDVDAAVKQRNDMDNEAVAILEQVDQSEDSQLAAQSKLPAPTQVASNSSATPATVSLDDVNAVNAYCQTITKVGLDQDAPLAQQDHYHKSASRFCRIPTLTRIGFGMRRPRRT